MHEDDKRCLKWTSCCTIFTVALIVGCVLIGLSVKVVEPEEYALNYRKIQNYFDGNVYEQGRWVLQPDSKLFRFSKVYTEIDFTDEGNDVICISADGMNITIDVVSQYKYTKDGLIDMVYKYDNYSDDFAITLARSSFLNTCGSYQIESGFMQNREQVGNDMLHHYQVGLNWTGFPATSEFAELRDIVYPSEYAAAIIEKQEAQQQCLLLESQRPTLITEAQTVLANTEQQALIDLEKASTEARAIIDAASSTADTILTQWMEFTTGLNATYSRISNMTPDEFVETYMTTLPLSDPNNNKPLVIKL